MPVMQSWSPHDSFPAGTSVGMRVSGQRDGGKRGAGAGDEVVVEPRYDRREERGYIDQNPGPRRPT